MMAVNCLTPNIPRLEMVNVPPTYSSGLSFPALALVMRSLVSFPIWLSDLLSADATIGVISPLSMATAKLTSTSSNLVTLVYLLILSPSHWLLTSGTALHARLAALMIKSLTEILSFKSSFTAFLKLGKDCLLYELVHLDLHCHVVVRQVLLALGESLADDLPHLAQGKVLEWTSRQGLAG